VWNALGHPTYRSSPVSDNVVCEAMTLPEAVDQVGAKRITL
jgi:hypothetical protein